MLLFHLFKSKVLRKKEQNGILSLTKKRQNAILLKINFNNCDYLSFFWICRASFMRNGVHAFLPFCCESFEH